MESTMDLEKYLSKNILDVLTQFRLKFDLVDYVKIEEEEFLKLTEEGFYLHAQNGDGKISGVRIYFLNFDDYLAADIKTLEHYKKIMTVKSALKQYGEPLRKIRSIRIPPLPATLPGLAFEDSSGENIISIYFQPDEDQVTYAHIKLKTD